MHVSDRHRTELELCNALFRSQSLEHAANSALRRGAAFALDCGLCDLHSVLGLPDIESRLAMSLQASDYPFAGRVDSTSGHLGLIREGGNIREALCNLWMLVAHAVIPRYYADPDLVSARIQRSEMSLGVVRDYLAEATLMIEGASIDVHRDLVRMEWHPVRKLQRETRLGKLIEPDRVWSRVTRRQFGSYGGVLSPAEARLSSPLGEEYLPWLDATLMWDANPDSDFFAFARCHGFDCLTGVSGVAMQIERFLRMLGVSDEATIEALCLAYLVPTRTHTYLEVMAAMPRYRDGTRRPDYLANDYLQRLVARFAN